MAPDVSYTCTIFMRRHMHDPRLAEADSTFLKAPCVLDFCLQTAIKLKI